jgi:hypothetical protein
MDIPRRRMLRAALLLAAAGCISVSTAQDGRTSSVQAAARDWLALTDRGETGESWDAAGKQFRGVITRERWSETLAAVRKPFGDMVQRSVLSTRFPKSIPGGQDGEYAMVLFRTSFVNRQDSRETVTLERESDGAWRVVGYVIQ